MTKEEFIKNNPNAEFIGYIKVGNRGVGKFFTDYASFRKYHKEVWDSGLDFESEILKKYKQ